MSSLKRLNREFESVSSNMFTAEDEAHLHCILGETLASMKEQDLNESVGELPVLLCNLHRVILVCETKSGFFWKTVELVKKIVESFQHKTEIATKLRLLPLLTDALTRSNNKIDILLKLIEQTTFGVVIKLWEPFLERLIKYVVQVIIDDKPEHDIKLRTIALSVLINLCSNNYSSLSILNGEINIVDLQKRIPDKYGFLACKLLLILNETGHMLRETDVRNFLKSTCNELHRIPSLDEQLLRHLVEFLEEIAERSNTKDIFRKYDFRNGIEAAIMTLENNTDDAASQQTNALFQVVQIILKANNNSLKTLMITILNFAMEKLKSSDCYVQALETLTCIFNHDPKMSTTSFEFEEMQSILKAILESKKNSPHVLISLFKLLAVLAKTYKLNLLSQNFVTTVLNRLLQSENFEYFKLESAEATMYLQCMVTISTLSDNKLFSLKTNIFVKPNVQQLIGMSIKHGDSEQCNLALMIVGNTTTESVAKIISSGATRDDLNEPEILQTNQNFQMNGSSQVNQDHIDQVLGKIEKLCATNAIESASTLELVDLYSNKIAMLKRRNDSLSTKVNELSKEISLKDRDLNRSSFESSKWEERWKNAEKSIETLLKEKNKLESAVVSLREELKKAHTLNSDSTKLLTAEKSKNIDLEKKVQTLEDELNEIEDMRLMVLNMMSKRKKGPNKEN